MNVRTGNTPYDTQHDFDSDIALKDQDGDGARLDWFTPPKLVTFDKGATEAADNKHIFARTPSAALGRWKDAVGTNVIASSVNVAYPEMSDNTNNSDIPVEVDVAVGTLAIGDAYDYGVVSGLPAGCELVKMDVITPDKARFYLSNNSDAIVPAGNVVVNIYKLSN